MSWPVFTNHTVIQRRLFIEVFLISLLLCPILAQLCSSYLTLILPEIATWPYLKPVFCYCVYLIFIVVFCYLALFISILLAMLSQTELLFLDIFPLALYLKKITSHGLVELMKRSLSILPHCCNDLTLQMFTLTFAVTFILEKIQICMLMFLKMLSVFFSL